MITLEPNSSDDDAVKFHPERVRVPREAGRLVDSFACDRFQLHQGSPDLAKGHVLSLGFGPQGVLERVNGFNTSRDF